MADTIKVLISEEQVKERIRELKSRQIRLIMIKKYRRK